MLTVREYKKAESLEEAWQLNQKKTQPCPRRHDMAQDGEYQRWYCH